MSHLVRLSLLLFLSVAGLFGGPILFRLGKSGRALGAMVDGLALGAVPLVVLLRLLPHAWASIGFWAVAACAAGFVALYLFDMRSHHTAERVGPALILPVLVLHSLADGAALSTSLRGATGASFGPLLVALLTHRLPEGLFVAAAFVPVVGWAGTVKRVLVLAAATVVGALLGEGLLRVIPEAAIDGVVAVGLGGMLHLAVHSHGPREDIDDSALTRALAGVALILGVAGALWLPAPDDILGLAQPHELSARQSVLPLFVTAAPSLLLALALGVLLDRRQGLVTTLPQTLALVLAPLGAFAAAAALSLRVLGSTATGLRLIGTLIAALGASLLAWIARDKRIVLQEKRWTPTAPRPAFWRGLDGLGARFLLGLGAVAALEAALGSASQIPVAAQAPLAVLTGLLLGTEPVSATLLLAVLVHKDLPLGPSLAAAVAAIVSPGTLVHLRHQLGVTAATVFALVTCIIAMMLGALVHVVADLPPMHPLLAHTPLPHELAAAGVLAALVVASILRLGPRGWLARAFG